jgi:hypothetical protein
MQVPSFFFAHLAVGVFSLLYNKKGKKDIHNLGEKKLGYYGSTLNIQANKSGKSWQ